MVGDWTSKVFLSSFGKTMKLFWVGCKNYLYPGSTNIYLPHLTSFLSRMKFIAINWSCSWFSFRSFFYYSFPVPYYTCLSLIWRTSCLLLLLLACGWWCWGRWWCCRRVLKIGMRIIIVKQWFSSHYYWQPFWFLSLFFVCNLTIFDLIIQLCSASSFNTWTTTNIQGIPYTDDDLVAGGVGRVLLKGITTKYSRGTIISTIVTKSI